MHTIAWSFSKKYNILEDKAGRSEELTILKATFCNPKQNNARVISGMNQPLHKRMYRQKRCRASRINDSFIYKYSYCKDTQHSVLRQDTVTLDKDSNWFDRNDVVIKKSLKRL